MQPAAAWIGGLTRRHALVLTWSLFRPQEVRVHLEGHDNDLMLCHSRVLDGSPARPTHNSQLQV